MAMNAIIKQKWVNALRSGKYKQGFGQLRTKNNCFCVLGVLCNIHAQENPKAASTQRSKEYYLDSSVTLPKEVRKWAGLPEEGAIKLSGSHIIGLNDTRKMSFPDLATAIEFGTI